MDSQAKDQRLVEILRAALVTGVVAFVTTWLSVAVNHYTKGVVPIWPANAVVLAAMILTPERQWAALLSSAFAAAFLGNVAAGNPPQISLFFSISNTVEISICSFGLRLFLKETPDLSRRRDLWAFVAFCLGSAVIAAVTTSRLYDGGVSMGAARTMLLWTFSDGLGLLIITPALLSLANPVQRRTIFGPQRWRRLALTALYAAANVLAFLQGRYSVLFAVSAAMLVLVFEMETAGAAIGLVLTAAIGEGFSVLGQGPTPLLGPSAAENELSLQIFLAVSALLNLSVAATLARSRSLQADLSKSEALYRLMTDKALDITIRYDRDWVIEFVSPQIRRLGYEPEALIGRSVFDFVHPEEQTSSRRARTAVIDTRAEPGATDLEFRVLCADGHWVWVQGAPSPIEDDTGQVIGALSVWRDIGVRKAAELALADSEQKYRLLAEHVTDVISRCDPNGILTYVSPSALRVLGYAPEEMLGQNVVGFMHPDDRAEATGRVLPLMEGLAGGASAARFEYRFRKKDGRYIWIEASPTIVRDAETGAPLAIQDCVRDVTARKALEAELLRKQHEAEAATIAKSDFLANMSHEIRTPLTGIIGFGALLEDIEGMPPAAARYIDRIATASKTLLAVVNDILDFSKIDAGQVELDPHAFDPTVFVQETVSLVSGQAATRGLALEIRLGETLPRAAFADGARLRQVLLNLLTNAIKFTEQGSVTVTADYSMAKGGALRFEVIDTGVGVPEELSHRLFQRFSQVDGSISRQFGGTGLGLAICKGLTEAMGGEIGVESRVGQGSTFWFTVPAPAADQVEPEPAEEQGEWDVEPCRILLVDDVEMNRALVTAMLEPFAVTLTEADNGADAVHVAMQQPFDLILMDLQMPGMDGLAAARAIRANSGVNHDTPILALSANILPTHLAACREAGMSDHIAKPIRPEDLLGKIAHWTDPRHAPSRPDEPAALA